MTIKCVDMIIMNGQFFFTTVWCFSFFYTLNVGSEQKEENLNQRNDINLCFCDNSATYNDIIDYQDFEKGIYQNPNEIEYQNDQGCQDYQEDWNPMNFTLLETDEDPHLQKRRVISEALLQTLLTKKFFCNDANDLYYRSEEFIFDKIFKVINPNFSFDALRENIEECIFSIYPCATNDISLKEKKTQYFSNIFLGGYHKETKDIQEKIFNACTKNGYYNCYTNMIFSPLIECVSYDKDYFNNICVRITSEDVNWYQEENWAMDIYFFSNVIVVNLKWKGEEKYYIIEYYGNLFNTDFYQTNFSCDIYISSSYFNSDNILVIGPQIAVFRIINEKFFVITNSSENDFKYLQGNRKLAKDDYTPLIIAYNKKKELKRQQQNDKKRSSSIPVSRDIHKNTKVGQIVGGNIFQNIQECVYPQNKNIPIIAKEDVTTHKNLEPKKNISQKKFSDIFKPLNLKNIDPKTSDRIKDFLVGKKNYIKDFLREIGIDGFPNLKEQKSNAYKKKLEDLKNEIDSQKKLFNSSYGKQKEALKKKLSKMIKEKENLEKGGCNIDIPNEEICSYLCSKLKEIIEGFNKAKENLLTVTILENLYNKNDGISKTLAKICEGISSIIDFENEINCEIELSLFIYFVDICLKEINSIFGEGKDGVKKFFEYIKDAFIEESVQLNIQIEENTNCGQKKLEIKVLPLNENKDSINNKKKIRKFERFIITLGYIKDLFDNLRDDESFVSLKRLFVYFLKNFLCEKYFNQFRDKIGDCISNMLESLEKELKFSHSNENYIVNQCLDSFLPSDNYVTRIRNKTDSIIVPLFSKSGAFYNEYSKFRTDCLVKIPFQDFIRDIDDTIQSYKNAFRNFMGTEIARVYGVASNAIGITPIYVLPSFEGILDKKFNKNTNDTIFECSFEGTLNSTFTMNQSILSYYSINKSIQNNIKEDNGNANILTEEDMDNLKINELNNLKKNLNSEKSCGESEKQKKNNFKSKKRPKKKGNKKTRNDDELEKDGNIDEFLDKAIENKKKEDAQRENDDKEKCEELMKKLDYIVIDGYSFSHEIVRIPSGEDVIGVKDLEIEFKLRRKETLYGTIIKNLMERICSLVTKGFVDFIKIGEEHILIHKNDENKTLKEKINKLISDSIKGTFHNIIAGINPEKDFEKKMNIGLHFVENIPLELVQDDIHVNLFTGMDMVSEFNLEYFNIPGVTSLAQMFNKCYNVKKIKLANLDTSKVKNYFKMFNYCFNLEDVSMKVDTNEINTFEKISMQCMFYFCNKLKKLNTAEWNVSKVNDMSFMFFYCRDLKELDVTKWNVSNVKDMKGMFCACKELKKLNVENWNVSQVKDMKSMFHLCLKIQELDINKWDVSNVIDMSEMFSTCFSLEFLNVLKWNVSNVKNMYRMFSACKNLWKNLKELDISEWEVFNVTNMSEMFLGCASLKKLNISKWDVSNVTNMKGMFSNCESLVELDCQKWNTKKVTDMSEMFLGCLDLEKLNISGWDVSKVTNMEKMFDNCQILKNIDISNWKAKNAINIKRMFSGCFVLEKLDISKWDISNVEWIEGMFMYCKKLKSLNFSNWNLKKVKSVASMFKDCKSLENVEIWNGSSINPMDIAAMFCNCKNLKKIDLSKWNLKNIGSAISMFENCTSLEKVKFNEFGGDNLREVDKMFCNCSNLKELDMSNWKLTSFCSASAMCKNCVNLEEIKFWENSRVNRLSDNISEMFCNCSKLKKLDFSNWNLTNVFNASAMCKDCVSLEEIKFGENINVNNIKNISEMFCGCKNLKEIDLSKLELTSSIDASAMFKNCINLKKVIFGKNIDGNNLQNISEMFLNCEKLKELDLRNFNMNSKMDNLLGNCSSLELLIIDLSRVKVKLSMATIFLNILAVGKNNSLKLHIFPDTFNPLCKGSFTKINTIVLWSEEERDTFFNLTTDEFKQI